MGRRFLRPLLGHPISKEHQGTDHLIAPLNLIDEVQLEWRKRRGRFHRSPFTRACGRGAYVAQCRETVIQEGTTRCAARGSRVDKGGLTSHICNDNYDETPIPLRGRPDDKN